MLLQPLQETKPDAQTRCHTTSTWMEWRPHTSSGRMANCTRNGSKEWKFTEWWFQQRSAADRTERLLGKRSLETYASASAGLDAWAEREICLMIFCALILHWERCSFVSEFLGKRHALHGGIVFLDTLGIVGEGFEEADVCLLERNEVAVYNA